MYHNHITAIHLSWCFKETSLVVNVSISALWLQRNLSGLSKLARKACLLVFSHQQTCFRSFSCSTSRPSVLPKQSNTVQSLSFALYRYVCTKRDRFLLEDRGYKYVRYYAKANTSANYRASHLPRCYWWFFTGELLFTAVKEHQQPTTVKNDCPKTTKGNQEHIIQIATSTPKSCTSAVALLVTLGDLSQQFTVFTVNIH